MAAVFVYVTTGSRDEALAIGRVLVESRLAACANVLAGTTSVYRWQGAIAEDDETSLIVKTQAHLVEAVTEKIKAVHSYDCPCVVALPIEGGNPEFLAWIETETSPAT